MSGICSAISTPMIKRSRNKSHSSKGDVLIEVYNLHIFYLYFDDDKINYRKDNDSHSKNNIGALQPIDFIRL